MEKMKEEYNRKRREHYLKNKERVNARRRELYNSRPEQREYNHKRTKEYYSANREETLERQKKYVEDNRKKHNKYQREWRKRKRQESEFYLVANRLRVRLATAFRDYSKKGKCKRSDEYGIDYQAICEYIGLCPGDREDYHIDHIQPLCSFDFDDETQIKKAFAPSNHQWLLAEENLKKGSKQTI